VYSAADWNWNGPPIILHITAWWVQSLFGFLSITLHDYSRPLAPRSWKEYQTKVYRDKPSITTKRFIFSEIWCILQQRFGLLGRHLVIKLCIEQAGGNYQHEVLQ
jgi:hypothetical protein